ADYRHHQDLTAGSNRTPHGISREARYPGEVTRHSSGPHMEPTELPASEKISSGDSHDPARQSGSSRWLGASIPCLILTAPFYRSAATAADPDIWGHVKMGERMLHTGELTPDTDPYSYLNSDYRVIDHEWLTRILVAAVFRVGGPTGLVVFKLVLSLGTLGLL